jgi:hypothetical protein
MKGKKETVAKNFHWHKIAVPRPTDPINTEQTYASNFRAYNSKLELQT